MSLREELTADALPGPACSVGVWLAQQTDPEWPDLMVDPTLRHSNLYRLASKHGLVCSEVTFRRHRTEGCACARSKG